MSAPIIERKWVQRGVVVMVTSPLVYYSLTVAGIPESVSMLTAYFWFVLGMCCVGLGDFEP